MPTQCQDPDMLHHSVVEILGKTGRGPKQEQSTKAIGIQLLHSWNDQKLFFFDKWMGKVLCYLVPLFFSLFKQLDAQNACHLMKTFKKSVSMVYIYHTHQSLEPSHECKPMINLNSARKTPVQVCHRTLQFNQCWTDTDSYFSEVMQEFTCVKPCQKHFPVWEHTTPLTWKVCHSLALTIDQLDFGVKYSCSKNLFFFFFLLLNNSYKTIITMPTKVTPDFEPT